MQNNFLESSCGPRIESDGLQISFTGAGCVTKRITSMDVARPGQESLMRLPSQVQIFQGDVLTNFILKSGANSNLNENAIYVSTFAAFTKGCCCISLIGTYVFLSSIKPSAICKRLCSSEFCPHLFQYFVVYTLFVLILFRIERIYIFS